MRGLNSLYPYIEHRSYIAATHYLALIHNDRINPGRSFIEYFYSKAIIHYFSILDKLWRNLIWIIDLS